jgi:hypothetical protein
LYVDDSGVDRVVNIDKSNADSADLAFVVPPGGNIEATASMHGQPRPGVVMRQVSCYRIDGANGEVVRRKFPIATLTAWIALSGEANPTVEVSGFTYFVTAFIGERKFVSSLIDTGRTDSAPTP